MEIERLVGHSRLMIQILWLDLREGVLTKPDMLDAGAIGALDNWREVLEGKKHQCQHGYYCVRLQNDKDRTRGLSSIQAKRQEDIFFSSTDPWAEMSDRNRFGVSNFVKFISTCLIKKINNW